MFNRKVMIARRSVLAVLLAAGVAMAGDATFARDPQREITIALSSGSLGVAIPRLAVELGLFEKRGIKANVVPMDGANTSLAALISGSADAAMVGIATVISATARGQDIIVLENGYGGMASTTILATSVVEKLGVSADAPPDEKYKALDGLLLATTEATANQTVRTISAADAVGAEPRFTYMAQEAMAAALKQGAIDGFLASAPNWGPPVIEGYGVRWISGPGGEMPKLTDNPTSTTLVMLAEDFERDPELADDLQGVFAEFRNMLEHEPDKVKAAVEAEFPNLSGDLLDLIYTSESEAWNAPNFTVDDIAAEIGIVIDSGANVPGADKIDPATLLPH